MLFVASCSAEKPRCRGGPVTRRRFLFFADSSQWNLRRIAERNGNVIRERELAASISPPKKNPKVPEASSIHFDLGLSAPYLDLPFLRSGIPSKSLTPRIRWDFTPGESFTLPPLVVLGLWRCVVRCSLATIFYLPFELISIILLVSLIGAITMARQ